MTPWKKILLSLFIVFHLAAVATWVMPDSRVHQVGSPQVEWYVMGVGVWQSWDMFSPDPSNLNMYLRAHVVNKDGSTWDYTLPRMDQLDYVTRYEQERFRKYIENIHLDANPEFWPPLARWIAHREMAELGKDPVHIELYRIWWNVPPAPMDTSIIPEPDWQSYKFYDAKLVHGDPQ